MYSKLKNMTTVKQQVEVTPIEMVEVLKGVEGNPNVPFVNCKLKTLYTEVLKTCKSDGTINPYFKQIYKVSSKNYKLVTNYEQRVKNNLIKEGKDPNSFVVSSPKGKKHISKSCLTDTETETKLYVMLEWFPEIKGTTEYEFEGNSIDKQLFEKWISTSESSNKKQGLDREIHPITPLISNIISISVNGIVYIIKE